jgi:uncharacterized damage-inducible protein DinB
MKLTDYFLDELQREAAGTRSALERVPEGKADWQPHEKSMKLGQLATLVATMPGWVAMMVNQNELDLHPPGGSKYKQEELHTSQELVAALEGSVAKAREALTNTTDEHLMTPWQFKVAGKVVSEEPRYVMIRDAVFNHLAHHRGQLTVYLRLAGASVPAIYGPSADEGSFG